jgi:CheY-like chemotaxis protein
MPPRPAARRISIQSHTHRGWQMTKILVIDDDDLVRETLQQILVRDGFDVVVAKDGRDGITKFTSARPDLVVTDVIMPDTDGIETVLALRQVSPNVPIIAVSGGGRARAMEFLAAAQKLGANMVLAKPVRRAELLAAVNQLLGTSTKGTAK